MMLVCGPMGSGKTTFAMREREKNGGFVLDLDIMIAAMTGKEAHAEKADPRVYFALADVIWAIAARLERLGKNVIVIRTAPGDEEMRHFGMQCVRIMIDVPKEICMKRTMARKDANPRAFEAAWDRWESFKAAWDHYFRKIEQIKEGTQPPGESTAAFACPGNEKMEGTE